VNKFKQFGLTTKLDLKPNQKYVAQIWRYGNTKAMLVVHSSDIDFYINSKTTTEIDNSNWDKIVIEFTTPDTDNPIPFTFYVWNPSWRKAYFDDLIIGEVN
jgi:hypothetical protein